MMSVMIEINGLDELRTIRNKIKKNLNPSRLQFKTIILAREAGVILHRAAVRSLIEAVYDHPNFPGLYTTTPSDPSGTFGGNDAYRMNDLLDAHRLREADGGYAQIVEVDPEFPVSTEAHAGREKVIDYAQFVHDGYVQWVYGHETGTFHPGRFWFRVAEIEAVPVILEYLVKAFTLMIGEAFV